MRSEHLNFAKRMVAITILLAVTISAPVSLADDGTAKYHELHKRVYITEALATLIALKIDQQLTQTNDVPHMLRHVVESKLNILSAAVRRANGAVLTSFGEHQEHWTLTQQDKSKPTQIQVPLYDGTKLIATVELRFQPIQTSSVQQPPYFAEVLAAIIATQRPQNHDTLAELLQFIVARNETVDSAAVRSTEGNVLVSAGNHMENWTLTPDDDSAYRFSHEPVIVDSQQVSTVEVVLLPKKTGFINLVSTLLGLTQN